MNEMSLLPALQPKEASYYILNKTQLCHAYRASMTWTCTRSSLCLPQWAAHTRFPRGFLCGLFILREDFVTWIIPLGAGPLLPHSSWGPSHTAQAHLGGAQMRWASVIIVGCPLDAHVPLSSCCGCFPSGLFCPRPVTAVLPHSTQMLGCLNLCVGTGQGQGAALALLSMPLQQHPSHCAAFPDLCSWGPNSTLLYT